MSESDDDVMARPFADFLHELRRGTVHAELSQKFHDLVAAVQETRKAGTLTFTVKVGIQPKTEMLLIDDAIAAKIPKPERDSSLWFVDKHGNPTRRDPLQLEFEGIRVVSDTNPSARKADTA